MEQASRSASVERKDPYRGNDYDKDDHRNYAEKDRYERSRSASLRRSPERRNKSPSLDNQVGNVLYVGNLSRRLNENDVRERFEKYGKVESIEMIKDPATQECRGFAFVQFEDSKDATEAIESLDQKEFDGRKMKVERSKRGRGYRKTPGEYLGHYKSRYNNGGGRRRSPSPYSRGRSSRGGGGGRRRSRSPRDYRDRYPTRRYSRSRSPGDRRRRDNYGYRDNRDRNRSRSNDRYRNDRYRHRDGERSWSRGRD